MLAEGLARKLGKAVLATGNADELRDPGNAGYLRLIPLLEVHAWAARQSRRACRNVRKPGAKLRNQGSSLCLATDHAAQYTDHAQDFGHRAVIEHMHFDAGTDEGGCDIGLQVGEAEHQVGLKFDDALDLGAGEGRNLWLLATRARRPHSEARDPDDAPVLAQQVEGLGRLLGQADNAVREFGERTHSGRNQAVTFCRAIRGS